MKKLLLIDGNSLMNRAFYALPPLMNKDGLVTNAIYGFLTMLYKAIEEYRPTHISVEFDLRAKTFRHKEYKDYKGTRKGMPDELAMQVEPLKEILDAMGVHRAELEGYEADDILGTLSKCAEDEGFEVLILTGDRDALQLASKTTKILFTKKGISEVEIYDEEKVFEKYELTPQQFIDLKGLMGDKSDNIPGVSGIGEKTGIKLLKEYQTLENLLEHTDELKGSVKKKLEEECETALISKRLATIVRNIPLDFDFETLKYTPDDQEKLRPLFVEYGFVSLLNKLDPQKDAGIVSLQEAILDMDVSGLLEKAPKEILIACALEEGHVLSRRIHKLYLCDYDKTYCIKEDQIDLLTQYLQDPGIEVGGYCLKEVYVALKAYGITLDHLNFDADVARYVLDPSKSGEKIETLALEYGIGRPRYDPEEFLGKGKKRLSYQIADPSKTDQYFYDVLEIVRRIKTKMLEKITEEGMNELFQDIELPLIKTLGEMEFEGIQVDIDVLHALKEHYQTLIDTYEAEVYKYAGETFNINSPKQLGLILFEKLGLPPLKKTKTGYSTNAEVLEKLYDEHPIIESILSYRQIAKLQSTYVEGLLQLINPVTGRIHSTFNQTLTSTGRISSLDPNLQNIPIRTREGRELRKVFVAKPGYVLVDADYSQIELRVLAHIAAEEKMIEGFKEGSDIHRKTASEVFSVAIDEVTPELRGAAKAVNFGIVYGISDFGLSNNLNIPMKQAKEYIELYFKRYPGIKKYMDEVVREVEEKGYSTTLVGRRRYIPELMSKNFVIKNLGKRLAMNTPIQGSAADIIKIAM
ncbi:MAG: DNA polymerase I, partial [Filifactor alocis]|nr:DNA polymerase I [Filifactor alocis]